MINQPNKESCYTAARFPILLDSRPLFGRFALARRYTHTHIHTGTGTHTKDPHAIARARTQTTRWRVMCLTSTNWSAARAPMDVRFCVRDFFAGETLFCAPNARTHAHAYVGRMVLQHAPAHPFRFRISFQFRRIFIDRHNRCACIVPAVATPQRTSFRTTNALRPHRNNVCTAVPQYWTLQLRLGAASVHTMSS